MKRLSKGGPQVRILDAAFSQEENRNAGVRIYAACLGGEEAHLKCVDPRGFAGSNPVCSAWLRWESLV